MGIFSNLFGQKKSIVQIPTEAIVENPEIKHPLSLAIVVKGKISIDENKLLNQLSTLDSSLKNVRYQKFNNDIDEQFYGLIGFNNHVIKIIGIDAPYPADELESCVAPAHYSQDIKQQVHEHDSHLILYYCGYDKNVFEQYLALIKVAAAFEAFNALAVINPYAHTSLPIQTIYNIVSDKDDLDAFCSCLLMFFCGFVKYEIENTNGVWMRTYGAEVFGLPNFAILAANHDEGGKYFDMFNNILNYLHDSGAVMTAGDTMEIAGGQMMSLRNPLESEYFLLDESTVLVIEMTYK